jgi:hypothetical protein
MSRTSTSGVREFGPGSDGSTFAAERRRLQNVSTTSVDSRGFEWTAVNETERRNGL